jgi:Flp pilus assembly protein TadG
VGRQTSDRGQSLVEFALVLPVFALILFGLFDLGRAVYAYNTISNASRESARVAIVNQTNADVEAEAIKQGVSLGLTDTGVTPVYADAGGTSCGDPVAGDPIAVGCLVSVTVVYNFVPATPIIGQLLETYFALNPLSSTTEMPVERTCPNPTNPALLTCPWP